MVVALNHAHGTVEGHFIAIEAPEGASVVKAVRARWGTAIVLETVMADDFIQYYCLEGNVGFHSRLGYWRGLGIQKNVG